MSTSQILKNWYDNQPFKNRAYIKAQLMNPTDGPGWSADIFINKMSRTAVTIAEQKLINKLFNEEIF